MHQRPPKLKFGSAATDNVGFGTVRFFESCVEALKRSGKEDAAFYFEQIVDHLRDGGSINNNEQDVYRILGL